MKSKPEKVQRECDCRVKENCPVEKKCLQKGVVYQATLTRDDTKVDTLDSRPQHLRKGGGIIVRTLKPETQKNLQVFQNML